MFQNQKVALTLLIAVSMLASSCSTSKGKAKINTEQSRAETVAELSKLCTEGSDLACHYFGLNLREQGKLTEALAQFKKACQKGWAHACTEQGSLERKLNKNLKASLQLSERSCLVGDAIGCYNAACYSCLVSKNKTQALEYLRKSYAVGFNNADGMKNDEDLLCVKNEPEFLNLYEKMKSRKVAYSTEPYHFFADGIGATIFGVPEFKVNPGNPITFYDDSGASVQFHGGSFSIQKALEADQAEFKKFKESMGKNLELLEEKTTSRNGLPFYFRTSRISQSGMSMIIVQAITGNEKFTVFGNGNFPEQFKDTYAQEVMDSVASMVLVPWRIPTEKDFIFEMAANSSGLKYAGENRSIRYYNLDGQMKDHVSPGLVLQPILMGADGSKFDQKYAANVTAQSAGGILNPSPAVGPSLKVTVPFSGYSQTFSGTDRLTQKNLEIKVSVLNTGKKIGQLQLGILAIVVSDGGAQDLARFEKALKNIKVRSSVFEKTKMIKEFELPDFGPKKGTGKKPVS